MNLTANASGVRETPDDDFVVLAHRGVHPHWKGGLRYLLNSCEASRILPPKHTYIENTIESVAAAFSMGASMVEIDVRQTADDRLILFHDERLECRTNGTGRVRDRDLGYLHTLDAGYGYTPDNGKTYPYRGKGLGKIPTLRHLLTSFPDRNFLIDHKDRTQKSAGILSNLLADIPGINRRSISYWGPENLLRQIQEACPGIRRMYPTRKQRRRWTARYLLTFGILDFPPEAEGLVFTIAPRYRKFIRGWPDYFNRKVRKAGGKHYMMVNTPEEVNKAKQLAVDGIVTDYIELVGEYI